MRRKRLNSAFQRSRRQIVAVVMTAFLLLYIVTLAMIYFLSYRDLYQENLDMLEIYVEEYRENGNPSERQIAEPVLRDGDGDRPDQGVSTDQKDLSDQDASTDQEELPDQENLPDQDDLPEQGDLPSPDDIPDHDSARYQLSSFYSVAYDQDGQPLSIDMGSDALYSEDQILSTAAYLLQKGISQGTRGNFVYCIDEEETYTLVVLMDNTLASDSFTTLFRYALLLGVVMVAVLFLCANALARWIIRPLEESDRRERQFISDASHELKTPVSVIEANAELLGREVGSSKWLDNIRSESSRMAALVNELLTLARTERETPQMEQLDFGRLVLGGVLPFESVAFEAGRKLDYQIEENVAVYGNSSQLSQLVSILMDNALSHSEGEGSILIRLSREKTETVLTISNPGFIPETDRAEIFSRFFRSDPNRSDTGHYGLGLTIAQNIVTAHQGAISVTCADGRVIFTVRFPNGEKMKSKTTKKSCRSRTGMPNRPIVR
ncbi:MAG: HAMP domain-containing histidine kinase [Lachnospiraceae bacterium]|nr:HAMP domain-containing histidine kinase [Lachnospiraceae bacterium]